MGITAKASDFKIEVTRSERVAERERRRGRTLKAEHAFIPRRAGQPISFLLLKTLATPAERRPASSWPPIWTELRYSALPVVECRLPRCVRPSRSARLTPPQ
jgi:hypothetical protein